MSEVNFFERSLRNIIAIFHSNNIKYMVIGGLANAKWGMPRATLDIDITIWVPDPAIEDLI